MTKRGWVIALAFVAIVGCKKDKDAGTAASGSAGSAAATASPNPTGTPTPMGSAASPAPNAAPGSAAAAAPGSAAAAAPGSAAAAAPGSAAAGSAAVTATGSANVAGAAVAVDVAVGSAAAGAGSGSATEGYKVGDTVYGLWTNGQWYPGKIGKINADGTYRVNYNDGDVSPSLPMKKIKPRTVKAGGGGGGGNKSSSSSGAEPCPASHWTRCGGNCYLLSDDRYNCGRCGNVCPSNKSICRNGTCDCTGVEKDSNGGVCP